MRKLAFFAILLLLAGCTTTDAPHKEEETDEALNIYTSIYPLQYAAQEIAGNTATVNSIYPPGVDAHTYEPATKEMTAIAEADVFFYLGAGMESFAESMEDSLASQPITFRNIEANEPELFDSGQMKDDDHEHDDLDPHIWLDPIRMIAIGEIIRDELIEQYPEKETAFTERFDSFKANMEELDESFEETLHDKQEKEVLVTHAAYGYWEERYGIEQVAISGISSSDEPSQKELTHIAELAKEKNLQYVIFEQNSSNQVASIIQEHIGAKKLEIHNLEVLTEEDIDNGEDYVTLMKNNLQVLDQATD